MAKLLMVALATVFLSACGPVDKKCAAGKVECGSGCMPASACCVPNGSGYCDAGWSCGADNLCHSGGGGGGNTCAAAGYAYTCINNLCSPGLWCCNSGCGSSCNTCR